MLCEVVPNGEERDDPAQARTAGWVADEKGKGDAKSDDACSDASTLRDEKVERGKQKASTPSGRSDVHPLKAMPQRSALAKGIIKGGGDSDGADKVRQSVVRGRRRGLNNTPSQILSRKIACKRCDA